ncbi:hypothetical protein ACK28Q_09520 [Bradyrhizobium japonicum]|uniref:hypothetical protein n=2 Tax=Nitrobacteraceae TaxID=41294 RepID=UPI0018043D8C|nr:hypothetical protein [Bradyrhizobium japonicum]MCS3537765.1 hypothetical protein [Bradyrhizobium japonicum]MCS4206144.1 hypothetical protein [Bradyrhizobium japonicum]
MLLFEPMRPSAVVPTVGDPTAAPASTVIVLLLPPNTSMPSLLAGATDALPKILIALFEAASKTMPAKTGSFRDVGLPSPTLTVTPLTPDAVLTSVLLNPVQVIESPDWSAICEPAPLITHAASAGVMSQGSALPAATAPIAVLKRNACRRHVFARRIWGGGNKPFQGTCKLLFRHGPGEIRAATLAGAMLSGGGSGHRGSARKAMWRKAKGAVFWGNVAAASHSFAAATPLDDVRNRMPG